mmetsp:Transcript_2018/g.8394  ORF Transcript_2018/g.8394 Transcript_2018/m.8394 type:complete len:222 (-) Transcript_2018:411-1076(-)
MRKMSSGVRMPATTSSPCAFTRYSPYSKFSPVLGLRVKQTPVPEVSPMFPNTIAWMFTAVPFKPTMPLMAMYFFARSLFQLSKTAYAARRICSTGSWGNCRPASSYTDLYRRTSSRKFSSLSSLSFTTPTSRFKPSICFSNRWWSMPITTSPYMSRNRRYESNANFSPAFFARPSTTSSFKPRFSTVSIMPGMETAAPERTDSKSGFSGSPSVFPMHRSTN